MHNLSHYDQLSISLAPLLNVNNNFVVDTSRMEKRFIIRDINSKPITALLYHVLRREIITGYEGTDSFNTESRSLFYLM